MSADRFGLDSPLESPTDGASSPIETPEQRQVESMNAQSIGMIHDGKVSDAIQLLNRALDIAKKSGQESSLLYANLGLCYAKKNDFEESRKMYRPITTSVIIFYAEVTRACTVMGRR